MSSRLAAHLPATAAGFNRLRLARVVHVWDADRADGPLQQPHRRGGGGSAGQGENLELWWDQGLDVFQIIYSGQIAQTPRSVFLSGGPGKPPFGDCVA